MSWWYTRDGRNEGKGEVILGLTRCENSVFEFATPPDATYADYVAEFARTLEAVLLGVLLKDILLALWPS